MIDVKQMYKDKFIGTEACARMIKSGDLVYTPFASNEPFKIWQAIADRKDELEGVRVRQFLTRFTHRHCVPEYSKHIFIESMFCTNSIRPLIHGGHATYLPVNFRDMPDMVRESGCDVLMMAATPMDEFGYFCYGLGCDYTPAAIEVAKKIIVEVNPNMPWTHGYNKIHITQVDAICESDNDLFELVQPTIAENDKKIAAGIVDRIDDGSTLQVGIGGVPAMVCQYLQNKKDLGMHTELITDYLPDLFESGALTGNRKTIHKGKVVTSTIEGTKKLFKFLDNNPFVELHPVDYTNDPMVIASNYKMCSIMGTIEVDLFGQCASENIGHKIYGGIGGQLDFARGVTLARDGKGFIALDSTAKDSTISRIVPVLSPGQVVTNTRTLVDHVATEYGCVKLRGKTMRERVGLIISIAHPNFRDILTFEARKMNLI